MPKHFNQIFRTALLASGLALALWGVKASAQVQVQGPEQGQAPISVPSSIPLPIPRSSPGKAIRIAGAPTVSLPISDAVEILKKEQNIPIEISTEGGSSSWGIAALGIGDADVAMSSRFITAEDRAQYPSLNFTEIYFGEESAVMVVSDDLWQAGFRAIGRAQAKSIYEGKIRNWKDAGGPDLPVTGYVPEQGRGVWACYIQWIYSDLSKMRPNRFALTNSDEESKACIETTPASFSIVTMRFAIDHKMHALAIKEVDRIADATTASVAAHIYPMSRPLFLVVQNRPLGNIKTLVDFVLSDRGQELVHKRNYLTLKDLNMVPQSFE